MIVVEDDLFLSAHALDFAQSASQLYSNETRVNGISLYAPAFSETAFRPFQPDHDQYDAYFMQQASSWGQIWSRKHWKEFREWYQANQDYNFESSPLPWNVKLWPSTSWKRYFMAFLMHTGRYFVYPKVSLSTNFSDAGTHQRSNTRYQVALQNQKINYRLPPFDASRLKYDIFYERDPQIFYQEHLIPESMALKVDLYGNKPIQPEDAGSYLLTSKILELQPIKSFGLKLKSHEENVLKDMPGDQLFLYEITANTTLMESGVNPVSKLELTYWSGLRPDLISAYNDLHLIGKLKKHLDDLIFLKHLRVKMWIRGIRRFLQRNGIIKR